MSVRKFTSLIALASANAAVAQTAAQPNQPPAAPAANTASTGEIIVTAQRRSERLVDVPISISTISAAGLELAGPTSLENLTKAVPGIYLQREVYGLSPTIRGIGSTLGTSGGEENVATYIDGVYQANASGNIFDLASVADVEVLKGPQGTLFGRNATGGALLIKTLDPTFTQTGRFNVSYEHFGQVRSSAYINIPLTDTLAINGSVAYRYSPGYLRDERTGAEVNQGRNFTARGKLLYKPTSNFSVILTASHADFDDPTGSEAISIKPANAYLLPGVDSGPIAMDPYHVSHNTKDVIKTNTDEYSAHVKWDLSAGTLTSITAYTKNSLYSVNDLDETYATVPAPITLPPPYPPIVVGVIPTNQYDSLEVDTKTFSQELNFTSQAGHPLTYVAGLYYFHNASHVPFVSSDGVPIDHAYGTGNAYAAYAEATYTFDKFSLIAGARYSHETRFGENGENAADPAPFTRFQNATDNKCTPRVGVCYMITPQSNLYATYSKGFKSGVFDLTSPTGPAVKPETVDAYEAGFKTSSRIFSFNIAGFYYNYDNTQVNSVVSGASGAIFDQLLNVPKSRIYGADMDATVRLGEAFDVHAAFAYTHARYIDFASAPGYTSSPAVAATVFGLLNANVVVNASGNAMVRAPEYTASATVGYHAKLGDGNRFDLTVSPYYSSRVFFDFANQLSQKAYVTLDGAATLTIAERVKLSVFGRNLTNRAYFTAEGENVLGITGTYAMPRTYGVSFGYSF